MTFFQTGSQIAGRPSLGSWVTYGLGSENENLPGFVVLVTKKPTDQPLYARLWGTGFLNSRYQGVRFSSGKDAVFYLSNPNGVCQSGRSALLDKLSAQNQIDFRNELDPEIETRIARRLAEKGVRFIQLYHPGWDQHTNHPNDIRTQSMETDQGCAAILNHLGIDHTRLTHKFQGHYFRLTDVHGHVVKDLLA